MHRLPQLVQPAPDRAIQQILLGPLDRRWFPQGFDEDRCRMLAVPSDRTAAPAGEHDRIGIIDLDKDMIGARPRSLNGGDQALPAFIGAQVANGTLAMIGTTLFETPGEATADIAFIEGD